MKTAAVLPAQGIGDALLMMIASQRLHECGYKTTTFHPHLPELSPWLPSHHLSSAFPTLEQLTPFSFILIENDNSPRIKELIEARREGRLPQLHIFYPTYNSKKHAPITPNDVVFDPSLPMADNIAQATKTLLNSSLSKKNGIKPLPHLIHRQRLNQVLIHPTSRDPRKNWEAARFINLAFEIKNRGLLPIFCVSPEERAAWESLENRGFSLIAPANLSELAKEIYTTGWVVGNDSLPGHLASNLAVPSVIIANDRDRMQLWRPGWHPSKVILPSPWIPNFKGIRLRQHHWQFFISVPRVLRALRQLGCPL